jgi:hypothetical protein
MTRFSCHALSISLVCGALTGCLAFKDFELEEESNVASTGAVERPCAVEGSFECSQQKLYQCQAGVLVLQTTCGSQQVCTEQLGRCTVCSPGDDVACTGPDAGVLSQCGPLGDDYNVVIADCGASGLVCAAELAPDRCVPCITGQARCEDEKTLVKCVDLEFASYSTCDLGCQDVDGNEDYCAQCSPPGVLACRGRDLHVCTQDLEFELQEECQSGCDSTVSPPQCL